MNDCREYERYYKAPTGAFEGPVDRNLNDSWLNALNGLTTLELTSICEGHPGANNLNQHEHPILRLQTKVVCRTAVLALWNTDETALRQLAVELIPKKNSILRPGFDPLRNTFFLDIDCEIRRRSDCFSDELSQWFTDTVAGITAFDRAIADRMAERC